MYISINISIEYIYIYVKIYISSNQGLMKKKLWSPPAASPLPQELALAPQVFLAASSTLDFVTKTCNLCLLAAPESFDRFQDLRAATY